MLDQFFYEYLMKLVDPFLDMQLRGVKVDLTLRDKLRTEMYTRQQEAAAKLQELVGSRRIMAKKGISTKVLQDVLYHELKLPVQFHPKTGKPTTNEEALDKLATYVTEDKREIFESVITIRDLGVLISTFLDVKLDADNRLRTSYNIGGTETGRLSSSNSPFWTGTNMQNWAMSVRDIVVADRGFVYVYGDGEQAEARVVGKLARDDQYLKIFDSGKDVHSMMAARIFSVTYEEIMAEYAKAGDYERRYLAKRTVHASNYGMGPRKYARLIKKPTSVAEALQHRYFTEFPSIKSIFQAEVRRELDRTRTLETPFGRRRQFFGRHGEDTYREGYAYVPQSTIADWLDIGLLRIWRWVLGQYTYDSTFFGKYLNLTTNGISTMKHVDIKPAIQIHDGLLCAVPVHQLRDAIEAIRALLTYPIYFKDGPLAIPVDIKIGNRWGTLKKPTEDWIATCEQNAFN